VAEAELPPEPEPEFVAEMADQPEPELEPDSVQMVDEVAGPPVPFAAEQPAPAPVIPPGDPDPVPAELAHEERAAVPAEVSESVPVPSGNDHPDRGTFLRLFSGLRES
jgi:hypothetical protein